MPKKPKTAAGILTVHRISEMTEARRRDIVAWLRDQIRMIQRYHKKPGFAARYTARYFDK